MQPFYKRAAAENPESGDQKNDHEEMTAVRESLWQTLEKRDNSNAATALLGLEKH